MIAGQWTVVDGLPVHLDLQELMHRHQAAARRLAQKARA
jgi:8-oxoguanine deaminase